MGSITWVSIYHKLMVLASKCSFSS